MGKDKKLEKKVKNLEDLASAGGVANLLANAVVAELNEPYTPSNEPSSAEKPKKSKKKRTKHSSEVTKSSPTVVTPLKAESANTQSVDTTSPPPAAAPVEAPLPAVASRGESLTAVSLPLPPAAVSTQDVSPLNHSNCSSSDSTTSPLMGATVSNSNVTSAPSETHQPVSDMHSAPPEASEAASALPVSDPTPMTVDRKVDLLSDLLYESLTDQIMQIRYLLSQMAGLVSEECHKACEAKLRKRPRPASGGATPKKRRLTGYQLFCQRQRIERTPEKQQLSELSRLWKELTEDERAQYRVEAERSSLTTELSVNESMLENSHDVIEE